MKSSELRTKYLEFFKQQGHKIIPSASLIPENDPTVLFTTAGMHPLVPYLLGQKHPEGTRLTDAQKCIRTGDIDDVGDDTHLTFFEMLGNWSLGDYWKDEAIKWSFEFLIKELKIPLERLAVSVFEGDKDAPFDQEAHDIWRNLGISEKRIAKLPKEDNWWGPAGKTGPCGPDTEMFYWKLNDTPAPEVFDAKNKNWVEIWNDVFMQYVKNDAGEFVEASQKNVDTGMGLERTVAVLNGKENVYETDVFLPVLEILRTESGLNYNERSARIFVDHIRASMFLIADGVIPSNTERGYVLRRLIRRAFIQLQKLKVKEQMIGAAVTMFSGMYAEAYPELKTFNIVNTIEEETDKFSKTLKLAEKEYGKIEERIEDWYMRGPVDTLNKTDKEIQAELERHEKVMPGGIAFNLVTTFGLPIEMIVEMAKEKGIRVELEEFEREMKKHKELSRTASAGMFKGGLADNSEQVTKYHTATHLLLAGLRKYLGGEVYQKGSNLTAERLRLDFSWPEKVDSGKLHDVENFVNGIINKDLPVEMEEMLIERARELKAMGVFGEKYGAMVKVYTILDGTDVVSREICGGPHVDRTGVLGHFKILKEESSSSGVRRIKAILE